MNTQNSKSKFASLQGQKTQCGVRREAVVSKQRSTASDSGVELAS